MGDFAFPDSEVKRTRHDDRDERKDQENQEILAAPIKDEQCVDQHESTHGNKEKTKDRLWVFRCLDDILDEREDLIQRPVEDKSGGRPVEKNEEDE